MEFLTEAITLITWKHVVMWIVGGLLIFLAIKFKIEPSLLLPMGFGAILVNIPLSNVLTAEGSETAGIIEWMFDIGIAASEAMPILLFIGIGAMIDFGPLLANPKLFLVGGAAQFGIFMTISVATLCGFSLNDAASIGIIGAADGPTSIMVAIALNSKYLGAIMVVAYSYMALVPIIQPVVVKAITTKKERLIRMDYTPASTSKLTKILFPIIVTLVAGLIIVSVNTGAYMAEIVRGGIISVDKGQFEGAEAIGMTHFQTMTNVVLPQALRNIMPSVANEFVINIKDTSVLNVIGFTELFFYAKSIVFNTYATFETYLIVAVIYFVLTFSITRVLRLAEKKMDGKENYRIMGSQNMDAESIVKENKILGGNENA